MTCNKEETCLPTPLLQVLVSRFEKPSSLQLAYWSSCLASPLALDSDHRPRRRVPHVISAPTGSGKTTCFLVPAISALLKEAEDRRGSRQGEPTTLLPSARPGRPRIVVVAPTRELAVQVFREAIDLTSPRSKSRRCSGSDWHTSKDQSLVENADGASLEAHSQPSTSQSLREGWLSAACLYGSVPPYHQVRLLDKGVHLLAATPGRLMDLLNQNRLSLDAVTTLIFDEYDRLLSGPLRNQVATVATAASSATHVFVSATSPSWLGFDEDTSSWRCKAAFEEGSSVLISELSCKVILTADESRVVPMDESLPALLRHCPWLQHSDSVLHFDARCTISSSAKSESTTESDALRDKWALRSICTFGDADSAIAPAASKKLQVLPAGVCVSVVLVDPKMSSPENSNDNTSIGAMAQALREVLIKRATTSHVNSEVAPVLRCLVFAETRVDCEQVARALAALSWGTSAAGSGHSDASLTESNEVSGLPKAPSLHFLGTLHGGKDQTDRFRSLKAFAEEPPIQNYSGSAALSILVCTDVAARGLHIHGITDVASFVLESTPPTSASSSSSSSLPSPLSMSSQPFCPGKASAKLDDEGMRQLVHRMGRVGRAGAVGYAHCFLPVRLAPPSNSEMAGLLEVQSLGWAAAAAARQLAAVLEASHRSIPPALSAALAAVSALHAASANGDIVNSDHVLSETIDSISIGAESGGNEQTLKAETRRRAKEAIKEVGMEMTEVQGWRSDHTSLPSQSLKEAADAAAALLLNGNYCENSFRERQPSSTPPHEKSTTSIARSGSNDYMNSLPAVVLNDEAWANAEAQLGAAVAESLTHLSASFRIAATESLQRAIRQQLFCGNEVPLDRPQSSFPGSNCRKNDLESWALAVSQLVLATVDAAAKALDSSTLTGPSRLPQEAAVVCVEGSDGVGGARGLQSAVLAVLLPLKLHARRSGRHDTFTSRHNNPQKVRVLQVTDKHASHGWHTERRGEKKTGRGVRPAKNKSSNKTCDGSIDTTSSSTSRGGDNTLRQSADPRLAHLCGGAAADCGPSCRVALALSDLESKHNANEERASTASASRGDDACDVPTCAAENSTGATLPHHESQPAPKPDLLPLLNIATRRGGLSSGPRARALAGDVRAFAQVSHATFGTAAQETEGTTDTPSEAGAATANAPELVVVVAGAAGCGLGAVRAVQLYEALLVAPSASPLKDSPSHPLSSSVPKQPSEATPKEVPRVHGVDREVLPVVLARCHLVLGPGCLPDPTGDHLLGKGAYAVGRRHQIEVQDLYMQNSSKATAALICEEIPKAVELEASRSAEVSPIPISHDNAVHQTTTPHSAAQCKWLSHLAQGLSKVTLATSDAGGVSAAVRCCAPLSKPLEATSSPNSLRRALSNHSNQLGGGDTKDTLAMVALPFMPSLGELASQTEHASPLASSSPPLTPLLPLSSVALGAVTCSPSSPLPPLLGTCPLNQFPLLVASATCAQSCNIDYHREVQSSVENARETLAGEAVAVAAETLREAAVVAVGALEDTEEGGKVIRAVHGDSTLAHSSDRSTYCTVAEDALFPPALLTVRDQMLLLLNRASRLIDGSTNGYMFRLRTRNRTYCNYGTSGAADCIDISSSGSGGPLSSGNHLSSSQDLNATAQKVHSSPSSLPNPKQPSQWGRVLVCNRQVWTEHGYAKEHYVSALPDTHALCLEFQVWVPAATPTATDISLHERQEISSSIGAMKYIEDMDDGANSAAADEARVEGRDRWQPAAFIAFGVYMCGSSMPWLPFQPTNKFDVAQVDRLVVLPHWRSLGAKELLLSVGCGAFHALGLPCRIKTASPSAHAAFLASPLLVCEGHRSKGSCGTGRGGKEGWVHWFNGAPVVNPEDGRAFVFAQHK